MRKKLWNLYYLILFCYSLRSAHTRGLAPATSPCNKSRGQVPSCELATFASKSSRGDQTMTCPINSNQFKFIFGTSPCDLFLQTLLENCLWDKFLRPVPLCKLFRGLVAGTSPLVFAHLFFDFYLMIITNMKTIQHIFKC